MSMSSWAEQECRIACKRENPNFDFDSEDFDYGCCCYKSALKAFKSLMEDGHSGASFGFTKDILIRLMDGHPLTPITDDDFPKQEYDPDSEWLKEQNLRSDVQCPRMPSLFRKEYLDGRIVYNDVERDYYINIEEPSDTYKSWSGFLDEMFPITMPYMPERGKYKIYAQTFLVDRNHGDFDTKGILYVEKPNGEKVDVNIFETEGDDGKMKRITKEEYEELLERRIDKVRYKVARNLIWTLTCNTGSDDEIKRRKEAYDKREEYLKEKDFMELSELCKFFDNPENYQYNTFGMHHALCEGRKERYNDITELIDIANYLSCISVSINE